MTGVMDLARTVDVRSATSSLDVYQVKLGTLCEQA